MLGGLLLLIPQNALPFNFSMIQVKSSFRHNHTIAVIKYKKIIKWDHGQTSQVLVVEKIWEQQNRATSSTTFSFANPWLEYWIHMQTRSCSILSTRRTHFIWLRSLNMVFWFGCPSRVSLDCQEKMSVNIYQQKNKFHSFVFKRESVHGM